MTDNTYNDAGGKMVDGEIAKEQPNTSVGGPNRKQRRNRKKNAIKNMDVEKLKHIIIKQLTIIFDESLCADDPQKEPFKDFRPLFKDYIYINGEDIFINGDMITSKSKRSLIKLYQSTARVAHYISVYHNLNTEVIEGGKDNGNV